MEMEDEKFDKNIYKLRNPGHAFGGICTLMLGVFIMYSTIEFAIKIINKESVFSENLYIANDQDKLIKYDTQKYGDSFNPGFGFKDTQGFGRGDKPFDPLDNDYV